MILALFGVLEKIFQILNFTIIALFQFIRLPDEINMNANPKGLGERTRKMKMMELGHNHISWFV